MGGESLHKSTRKELDADGLDRMASRAKTKVSRRRMRVRWQSMPVRDKNKLLEEDGGLMELSRRQESSDGELYIKRKPE